jgi:hypothetical protein
MQARSFRGLVWLSALMAIVLGVLGVACSGSSGSTSDGDAGVAAPLDAGQNALDAAPGPGDGPTFNVASAVSGGNLSMRVTFDAPPDPAEATNVANYSVPDLVLSGTPTLSGNEVTITTSGQLPQTYVVTVSGVSRASDHAPLATAAKTFTGHAPFKLKSAAVVNATTVSLTFSDPPDATQAASAGSYDIPGLTVSAPQLAGSVVTLTTTAQAAQAYTVTVTGVTRATDSDVLAVNTADFTGRTPFTVASAASTSTISMTVSFDDTPDQASATTLANYSVPGLTLSGTPVLNGNDVTLKTSGQAGQVYTVTVSNVTRASDGEPLDAKTANFNGTAVLAPTVTNVAVTATNPDNGTTPYNTGTTTVTITGTDFNSVVCPAGVKLDDLDGIGNAVGTAATACTVDSDTQITATFPAGIRTNGATGWNVRVTNTASTNATSAVPFVPIAGLLISEVYTGTTGNTDHEFLEIYNPTSKSIDTTAGTGIGVRLHIRNSGGTDTGKTLTAVTTGVIPSHGFLLFVSSVSDTNDAWYASRDYTYSAALVANGGAYISLSATKDLKVLDKVGWGSQPAGGFEGTAAANIASDSSSERKPAGGLGHATDTDSNVDDFLAPTTTLTPRGTADAAQP